MTLSYYQVDKKEYMHQGSLYEYRPFFWLEPPLFLLRNINWSPPRTANIHQYGEVPDAFRRAQSQGNEEDVIAKAKLRFLIVISKDKYIQHKGHNLVMVAPMYSIDRTRHRKDFVEKLENMKYIFLHHIPADSNFQNVKECYIDFHEVRSIRKEFMSEGKLGVCLTTDGFHTILSRYKTFL